MIMIDDACAWMMMMMMKYVMIDIDGCYKQEKLSGCICICI